MDQFKNLINGLSLLHRASIVAAVLMAGGAIYAVVHFRHEGDFRPLYTAMAPEDAAQVVQKLKESGVEYRLSENGGTVMVASARLADSRLTLASAGLPKSGRIGFELFDKTNFGATELVEHINYQRALEGELERSIMGMAEVAQARVHLTFPKESVFLDQQQPAKASVMVKLYPGAKLSAQNVVAVTHLIASAVEGLGPDGVAVLEAWRRAGRMTPVLILTARDRWSEKVQGFDAGADDYVAKPFHMEEVLARLRALLRRAAGHATNELAAGPVRLDARAGRVTVDGAAIKLTSHEYRLLSYLMHHAGRVVSRTEIVEHLYDQDFDRDSNTIEVFVGRLRKKLGVDIIQTVRGLGYLVGGDGAPAEAAAPAARPSR